MRTVVATRYVTPLREGGSMWQSWRRTTSGSTCSSSAARDGGRFALVAELVAGEIGRALGGSRSPGW